MTDFAKLATTAQKLIRANGRNVTLRSFASAGDPWNPTQTTTDMTVKAVFSRYSSFETDGELIRADDVKVLIEAAAAPSLSQRIIDGSVDYSIVNVRTVKPGDVAMLYIAQARK